ncbi:MAG: 8-amino-7-oxononanoate synthase [Planctomycetota bacterium]
MERKPTSQPPNREWRRALDELAGRGLLRKLRTVDGAQGPRVRIDGRELLCFCSNNYLGLACHPALVRAARRAAAQYGTGSGASRLVSGSMAIHRELEDAVARFKRADAAIVFPTGYMANLGVIQSLVGRGDVVYCDRLNHASIIDGCRLSGATLRVYPHKDAGRLDRLLARGRGERALVVTDTVFSMDGDLAPLPDLVEVCERHGATLMIDEAHATGVLGATGRGATEHFGIEPGRIPVVMGTLSKAVGSFGGYVVGAVDLIELLVNKARSFIYTTAPPPAVCAASIAGLRIIDEEPGRRAALWERTRQLQDGLRRRGLAVGETETPITPVIVGEADAAVALSRRLLDAGVLAPAIRPPTVPDGTARVRLAPMAAHTPEDVETVLDAIA